MNDIKDLNMFEFFSSNEKKLDVVKMDFIKAESLTQQELFSGFNKLYAILINEISQKEEAVYEK